MKKFVSALAIALALTASASAQVKLGLKGGLNVSKMSVSSDVLNSDNRAGWFIGPTVKFSLPVTGLGIDVSALYDQKSTKVKDVGNSYGEKTISQKTIDIPINLRYGIGLGSEASFLIFAGPQFDFNVGDKNFSWTSSESYENTFQLKKSMFSVNVGLGVSLLKHVQLTANYNIACSKTGEATVWNTVQDLGEAVIGEGTTKNGRTNSWQIAVAYFF